MRLSLPSMAGLAGIMLSACTSGTEQPTTDLPVKAPEGASELVIEFVEMCSAVLAEPAKAGGIFSEYGWEAPSLTGITGGVPGMIAAEKLDEDLNGNVTPFKYPHVEGVTCMITGYGYGDDAQPDLTGLDEIAGFPGKFNSVGDRDGAMRMGAFSAIGPSGDVITITSNVMTSNDYFNLMMTTSTRVSPDDDDKQ